MLALAKPNPPTIVSPSDGTPITLAEESVQLVWVHNPTDGTEQESATLQYRINGDEWTAVTVADVSYYDLALDAETFAANDVVEWRVCTKGAYATASNYSAISSFVVYGLPEITFTEPDNGTQITNLPVNLAWDYSDESGTLAELILEIWQEDTLVKTVSIDVGDGTTGVYSYSLADYIFENETAYSLVVRALSSTGLSATDEIGVTVSYVPVVLTNGLFPDVELDEETGYANIVLNVDEAPVETPDPDAEEPLVVDSAVESAYLYRVVNGERTLIGSGLVEGDQVVDRNAPLNCEFSYELLMVAESGQLSLAQVDEYLDTVYFFAYWGDEIARALWNPSGSISLARPEKTQVRYSGRTYPVTYDSKAIEQTYSLTFVISDREELDAFRRLINDGGQGVWKSADGDVYAADFTFSYSAEYARDQILWNAQLDVTRIESEEL